MEDEGTTSHQMLRKIDDNSWTDNIQEKVVESMRYAGDENQQTLSLKPLEAEDHVRLGNLYFRFDFL